MGVSSFGLFSLYDRQGPPGSARQLSLSFDRFLFIVTLEQYYRDALLLETMIRSFADRDSLRLFQRLQVKHISIDLQRAAYRKLLIIDAAGSISDLRIPPGNRLEKLAVNREGQYSIRINEQWRICFKWRATDAFDVEITDYHA